MAKLSKMTGKKAPVVVHEATILGTKVPLSIIRRMAFYRIDGKLYFSEHDATLRLASHLGKPYMDFITSFYQDLED